MRITMTPSTRETNSARVNTPAVACPAHGDLTRGEIQLPAVATDDAARRHVDPNVERRLEGIDLLVVVATLAKALIEKELGSFVLPRKEQCP